MSEIQELKQLLPFYVNGTLNAADCARVDAGLINSLELRRELAEVNALAQLVREGGQELTQENSDVEMQLDQLTGDPRMQQTISEPVQKHSLKAAPSTGNMLAFLNPKNWHPAISLALAVAAITQAGYLVQDRQQSGQQIANLEKKVGDLEYQLASGPGSGTQTADILVQVKPGVSWQAFSDLLTTEGLTIVDGPSDNTLSLSSTLEGADLDALIARLRTSGLIETADKAA